MTDRADRPLGVALTAHWLTLEGVLRLSRRADELGYALVLVDGDSSFSRPDASRHVYDATALSAAVGLATRHARIASIRFAHFWNALVLARSLATLSELSAGRWVNLFGVGAPRRSAQLGLPEESARERVARLDETLGAVRALLAGETVTQRGRFVSLDAARITPPSRSTELVVSAAGPRALEVVRRRADVWDANVPPLRARLEPLREKLGRTLPTWLWVFARPGESRDAAVTAYRRHAPWFADLADGDAADAVLWGEAARCRDRLARVREELDVALPIVDLSGLDEAAAERALVGLAEAGTQRIL